MRASFGQTFLHATTLLQVCLTSLSKELAAGFGMDNYFDSLNKWYEFHEKGVLGTLPSPQQLAFTQVTFTTF